MFASSCIIVERKGKDGRDRLDAMGERVDAASKVAFALVPEETLSGYQ
jgi:hypothetical protein